jgi:hypothetical protein
MLEVGIDGQIGCLDHLRQMIQYAVTRHAAITVPVRPREARTRRGQRLESQTLQIPGAAHIPGIGNHEATVFVQSMKCTPLVGDAGSGVWHDYSRSIAR